MLFSLIGLVVVALLLYTVIAHFKIVFCYCCFIAFIVAIIALPNNLPFLPCFIAALVFDSFTGTTTSLLRSAMLHADELDD